MKKRLGHQGTFSGMEIKKVFSLFVFSFLVVGSLFSQMKKGEQLYSDYNYTKAIKKYEQVEVKTSEVQRKLAESYLRVGNTEKSEYYYEKLAMEEDPKPKDLYNYSYVLSMNGKYQEAQDWMEKYFKAAPGDTRAKKRKKDKDFYRKLLDRESNYTIRNLDANSVHQDFGVSYYKDKVVFASSANKRNLVKRVWNWNSLPFLDMYQASVDSANQLLDVKEFDKPKNKKYHEGPATFNEAGTYMVFTRNNYENKSQDGIVKLQLYSSEFQDGKWHGDIPLPYNSSEYSVGHGSLTPDGKTLYFASDMPGGVGGVDLYKATRRANGTWGKAENLGPKINTEGDEMFPFIHAADNLLFFASNGHLGLGGLDIFVAKVKENKFGEVQNLGVPINSMKDDFSFVLDKKSETGFFASNREEGKGDDDIYSFVMLRPYIVKKVIKGTLTDENGEKLSNARVILYDTKGYVIKTIVTDHSGTYELEVDPDEEYVLQGSKDEHFTVEKEIKSDLNKDEELVDILLEKDPGFSLFVEVFDLKTKEPISNVDVTVVDNVTHSRVNTETRTGGLRILLLDVNTNDTGSYQVTLKKEGYFPKTVEYKVIFSEPGQYDIHSAVDLSMRPLVGDIREMVKIKPIYFDVNKSELGEDAKLELDKVVRIMNQYPKMIVELSSHTDCRARKSYNLRLSQNRAAASVEYIKTRIINPGRISGKGYGESRLLNHCECESRRVVPCTREEHQVNRRTEFKIISAGDVSVEAKE